MYIYIYVHIYIYIYIYIYEGCPYVAFMYDLPWPFDDLKPVDSGQESYTCIHIYIYIYIYMYHTIYYNIMYYTNVIQYDLSLPLSLYTYTYIYIYIHMYILFYTITQESKYPAMAKSDASRRVRENAKKRTSSGLCCYA